MWLLCDLILVPASVSLPIKWDNEMFIYAFFCLEFVEILKSVDLKFLQNLENFQLLFLQTSFLSLLSLLFVRNIQFTCIWLLDIRPPLTEALLIFFSYIFFSVFYFESFLLLYLQIYWFLFLCLATINLSHISEVPFEYMAHIYNSCFNYFVC